MLAIIDIKYISMIPYWNQFFREIPKELRNAPHGKHFKANARHHGYKIHIHDS